MEKTESGTIGGYRDSRGEWRPENPVTYAPVFTWPPKLKRFLLWLLNYIVSWNLIYLVVVLLSYYFLQPPLEEMKTLRIPWIAMLLIRNMALVWIVYGGWHLFLYKLKARGNEAKYSPRWQNTNGSTFLWNDQVYDNVFWACASAVPIWTAYETLTFWLYANQKIPYLDFNEHPVIFVLLFLLIPIWREFHFYLIHRLIHWKPLYDKVHYLHHYNINPGPWSGLAMHPVEHILYFSVVLIHWIVPSHPLHFLFNSQHTALTPAPSHSGFEGKVFKYLSFGSYFHYLHHRLFECNYGESTIPMDKWFGIFEDGSKTQTEKQMEARSYTKLAVSDIVDESPEVKSIYLTGVNGNKLKKYEPGQHLTFKIPFRGKELCFEPVNTGSSQIRYSLRSYSISGGDNENQYRISVKREPGGYVSNALHASLKPGDVLQARGPKGNFIYKQTKRKLPVFIAAGIGITPILAMLKSIKEKADDIYLILAAKDNSHLCFKDEISQLCKKNRQIKVHVFFSRENQIGEDWNKSWAYHLKRVSTQSLKAILPQDRQFSFYICGPEKMTALLVDEIRRWKGRRSPVYTESFGADSQNAVYTGNSQVMHVHFQKSNRTVEWDHEFKNILEFAESNDIILDAGCMFGECGACSTRLVSGTVGYNHETAAKPLKGNCLICSSRPSSDIVLDA